MEELFDQFEKLKTDKQRWDWIQQNQDKGITVNLDNDDTYATFDADEDGDYVMQIQEYIGCSDGIFSLLEAMGIKCEYV